MGSQMTHPAGNFCWFELATSDQEAAKAFYTKLFGWQFRESPLGNDQGVYTTFTLDGKDVGAAYTLMPDQVKQGVPPNWLPYIAVASADAAAEKATSLGGAVLMAPFDVWDFGRMSVVQDPEGAVFGIWESKTHHGADTVGVPGSACWNELWTSDSQEASGFYSNLFGWGLKHTDVGMPYTEIQNGANSIGGILQMDDENFEGVPPNWLTYFAVSDCEKVASNAVTLGGTLNMPPTAIPNVGTFSVICDPQGGAFAVIQLAQ